MPAPLLLGHRGARSRKSIPENTVASFDQALADGCDGFEFDVRRTADGEAVICHDPRAGGLPIARTESRQLPDLPRLEEVLTRYQSHAFLDIELKVAGLEQITSALLRANLPQRGVVVSSFLHEVLRTIHGEDASLPLGLICETKAQMSVWSKLPVDYVMIHYKMATAMTIDLLKSAGKKVFVWTVNAPAAMRRFAVHGVDGIISDDTRTLRQEIRGRKGSRAG